MTKADDGVFWDLAEPFLAGGAEHSTMMGNPCLRSGGAFFASLDHRSGDLIVKLPAERVDELIECGEAKSFSPNGRRFKEWASVPPGQETAWQALMEEALEFAGAK